MKGRRRKGRGGRPGPRDRFAAEPAGELTSLVDVTFLLLVFFLVSFKFIPPEQALSAHLPTGCPFCHRNRSSGEDEIRVRLELDQSGETTCQVNYHSIGKNWRERLPVFLARLRPQVRGESLVIDGAGEVPFEDITRALDAGRWAEYDDIAFALPRHLPR